MNRKVVIDLANYLKVMKGHFRHLDAVSVGLIDFTTNEYECLGDTHLFFDLASVSKVLGNAGVYLKSPELVDSQLRLLLEHRAGLPAWGILPKADWKEIIQAYPIKESDTVYSDFSAMRFSLEIEKKTKKSVLSIMKDWWHEDVFFWRDLPKNALTPISGQRGFELITRDVHDPNSFNLKVWTGHAGLFSTIKGVCETLLNFQKHGKMIEKISSVWHEPRFVYGWDRVIDPQSTIAGMGCSQKTFGHLGFTGTSVWIDAEKRKGVVILSNATRDGWYVKDELNDLRRSIGGLYWKIA